MVQGSFRGVIVVTVLRGSAPPTAVSPYATSSTRTSLMNGTVSGVSRPGPSTSITSDYTTTLCGCWALASVSPTSP